jgi:hypothetical protein
MKLYKPLSDESLIASFHELINFLNKFKTLTSLFLMIIFLAPCKNLSIAIYLKCHILFFKVSNVISARASFKVIIINKVKFMHVFLFEDNLLYSMVGLFCNLQIPLTVDLFLVLKMVCPSKA